MAISLKEKVKVHDLWLVGCFLHPFLREMHFVLDMDIKSQYKSAQTNDANVGQAVCSK